MEQRAIIIDRRTLSPIELKRVVDFLKETEYKSLDYLEGILDGYLFDKYRVYSLEELEQLINEDRFTPYEEHAIILQIGVDSPDWHGKIASN